MPHLAPFPWVLPASSFQLHVDRNFARPQVAQSSLPGPFVLGSPAQHDVGRRSWNAIRAAPAAPWGPRRPGGGWVGRLYYPIINEQYIYIYIPMISLWFPHDVPIPYYFQIISLLFPYDFLIIYLLFTYYFHIGSHYFLFISLLYPHNFPIIKLCPYYFPIVSLSFLFGWLTHGFNHHFRIFFGPITNSVDMIRSSFQQVSSAILVV